MYNSKNILYIISAISSIEKIKKYSFGFDTAKTFFEEKEQLHFNASITLLIAIAEEIKKIETGLLLTESNIEWQNISDMRNILAHDCRGIDSDIVFDVIVNELPKLNLAFIRMTELFSKDLIAEVLKTNQYKHLSKII